jgi:SAM-dependent methyltransferase
MATYSAIQSIAPAVSTTHQHIAAVLHTLLEPSPRSNTVRILDVGCGDGRLLAHLLDALPKLRPDLSFEVFGLDISDAGQQEFLTQKHPFVNWDERLRLISARDKWPYPDKSFDFITSNQVMEHVMDHSFVFREIARCLRSQAVSVNVFPVREVLWEGHALMPLVHRIKDEQARARLMLFFAMLGFRRHYHREMQLRGWKSLREFARIFAHVLQTDTNYISAKQLVSAAEHAGLRISFAYTKDYFLAKALSYLGRRPYRYRNTGTFESVAFLLGKSLASVTVMLTPADEQWQSGWVRH